MFTAKYSTTTPTNALRPSPGDVAISVNAGNDGPTSTTGWYNGYQVHPGYLVIRATNGTDPDYYPCVSFTELINLAKYTFGQSSISNTTDALYYFLLNPQTFVINAVPNNVVTDNGHLNIDASVLGSFSDGDAALDLTGNQLTGRVENGVRHNKILGAFDFDGVDDKISYNTRQCAGLDAWSWQSTVAFDVIQEGATSPYYQLYIEEFAIWIAQYANAVGIDMRQNGANWFDGNGGTVTGAQIGLNNIEPGMWNHFTWTLEQPDIIKGYFNGELEVTIPTGQNGPIATGTSNTNIGSRYGSKYFNGMMRDTKTYSSTLTEEQVRQNYHLGPVTTSDLLLSVDAANLVSYAPDISTTTFSLTPTNIKQNNPAGTLTNGVEWGREGSGFYNFDGTDDYINFGNDSRFNLTRQVTMELWFKLDALPSSWTNIFGKMNAARDTPTRVYTVFINSSGYIHFTNYSGGVQYVLDTTSFISAGNWYHWVGTINRDTAEMKTYVNGAVETTRGGIPNADM